MNRGTKLLVLLIILALAGFGAWYFMSHESEEPEEEEPAQKADTTMTAFSVDLDKVKSFSWTCLSRSGEVEREGDHWVTTDENGEKQTADQSIMDTLTGEIALVTARKVIENVAGNEGYGFEDPICEIHIEADQSYTLVFGDPATSDEECYYFTPGDGHVYLVPGTMSSDFFYRNSDLLPKETAQ
ncbi:MAG: DUF4340 domain-containing protein [Firmicutes bacterium]|nr:DUF4340 domain-containing protein [Bacillota bacterium]